MFLAFWKPPTAGHMDALAPFAQVAAELQIQRSIRAVGT